MTVPAKLAGFLVALAAVFGVAFLTGTQSSALIAPPPEAHVTSDALGGLTAAADGYTLAAVTPELEPGTDQPVELTLTGPDGGPVGALTDVLGAPAHLVAVRRDLAGFQHLTPVRGAGAAWRATLDLTPGPWRLMLEVQPKALGRPVMLGVDLTVRGPYGPEPAPPRTDTVTVEDLEVRLSGGPAVRPGVPTTVTVTAGGEPVRDLQPIHGAPAHAVVIRPGDLGLAHLHAPAGAPGGPQVEFEGGVPEPGAYAVFVELERAGRLHVAAYTVQVER